MSDVSSDGIDQHRPSWTSSAFWGDVMFQWRHSPQWRNMFSQTSSAFSDINCRLWRHCCQCWHLHALGDIICTFSDVIFHQWNQLVTSLSSMTSPPIHDLPFWHHLTSCLQWRHLLSKASASDVIVLYDVTAHPWPYLSERPPMTWLSHSGWKILSLVEQPRPVTVPPFQR